MSIDWMMMSVHAGAAQAWSLTPGGDIESLVTITSPALSMNRQDLDISYIGTANNGTPATSYTFSSQSIGAAPGAGEARWIVVTAAAWSETEAGSPPDITSITVGGISASRVTDVSFANSDTLAALYVISVGSGTTANIVVNGTNIDACAIAVHRIIAYDGQDFTSAANRGFRTDTYTSTNSGEGSVTFTQGIGVFVGINVQDFVANGTTTWTTPYTETEDIDATVSGTWSVMHGAKTDDSGATYTAASSNTSADGTMIVAVFERD